jgi:hypothetical protein
MAENNHRSHGDPAATCSAPTPPRDQPYDRLAELARLIGQSVPMNDLAPDTKRPTLAGGRLAREFNPPAKHGYAAPDDVLQKTSEEQYLTPEQSSYDFDPPKDRYDDGCYEPLPRADPSRQPHPDAADLHVESSGAGYDEYEDQSHDHPEDHAYGEDYEENPNLRRRGKFIFVAAVFGLALLGTAGAFAYRGLFGGSIVPSLPSIPKAEGGPNIPTSTASQGSVSAQADAHNAGSSERLVPREERTVDVPPSVSTAPQPVSAAPILGTDQPNAADSAASQPQSVPVRPTTQQEAAKPSDADGPLSIVPSSNDATTAAAESARPAPPARPAPVGKPAATEVASTPPAASGGGYAVQVSSQRNEKEVQSSFRALQAKYPNLLGGREPMVRRADLGGKGVYYRTMVGPFVSAEQANELCSNLKAAGGSCIVQKN